MTTVLPPKTTDNHLQDSVGRRDPGRFRTTPGRLRLLSIVSVGAIVLLLIVSAGALSSRRGAAHSVRDESGPCLTRVQNLYQAFADADARASTSLLAAGGISIEERQRYLEARDKGGRLTAKVADCAGSSETSQRALAIIAKKVPRYSEMVEAARDNNRLGNPIGAQRMRDASELMRGTILLATLDLYTSTANALHDDYERGTSASQMVWIVVIGIATLVILVVTQIYAARRSNRILNVGLVVATVIVALLLVWSLLRFNWEQNALVRAQRNGSDSVQLLSSARILALQAQANENIALSERGTGQAFRDEATRVMTRLCGNEDCTGGLLAAELDVAARTGSAERIQAIQQQAAQFWSIARNVAVMDDAGDYTGAVDKARGEQTQASNVLDASIVDESRNAQARFDDAAHDAGSGFAILTVALTLGLLLAGALVLIGLQPRIGEYR
jgi:hypothetical protein